MLRGITTERTMMSENFDMVIAFRNILVFSVAILTGLFDALAQPKGKVEFYTTEQGLSHQSVTTLLKDKEGFMWLGSWDGINRFDGHSFVAYKSLPGDMSELGNGRIDQIMEDQSGHLWIEAYDKQVYRFDKKTEQFQSVSRLFSDDRKAKVLFDRILSVNDESVWFLSDNDGIFSISQNDLSKKSTAIYNRNGTSDHRLPSNDINFYHEDQEKGVWVGTSNGLCYLVKSTSGNYKNTALPQQLANGKKFVAVEEDNGQLFFGTADGSIIIFDKRIKSFVSQKITDGSVNSLLRSNKGNTIYVTTSKGELISFDVLKRRVVDIRKQSAEPLHRLYEDAQGFVWIEPEKTGVVRYNPFNHAFQFFVEKNAGHFNVIGNRFKILEDNNGLVWVNMRGGGFGYYDPQKQSIENILNTPDGSVYKLPNIVYSMFFDKAGVLWLTTDERELIKIILQGNDFRQRLLNENGYSRADNEVRGILSDNQDRLWVGAKSGQLFIYKDDKKLNELFDNEPPKGIGLVYSMLQDSRGNIWLGTKGNGLFKAVPLNKEQSKYHLVHFLPEKDQTNGLWCNEIYSLLEDKQGRIWIGSFDQGLVLVQQVKDSVSFIHTGNAFINYPQENFRKIRHMALDAEGNIWMGTTNGLLILDADDKHSPIYKYATYSKIPGDVKSLGNNDIQFVHLDSKKHMWLATSGGGICNATGKNIFESLKFRNYTTKDGLPNDYTLSIGEDKSGHLWIATENGLSEFRPGENIFKNYDCYEGLARASFSEAAVSRFLHNDQLVFGTSKGYVFFNPLSIANNRIEANLVFTNIQINNKDIGPRIKEGIVENNVNYISGLKLKYDQNTIIIDYSILDYRTSNRPEFAYRLVGFDNEWHNNRNQRRVTYTNLSPGHYVFEVKSLNSDLYSNTPFRKISITILPPWWKTWWAYTLYTIAAIVLLFFIRRTALAMIRLRNKIAVEQKLAALKLRFFTNVSHELRTPLTLIVNPIEQVLKKENLSAEGNTYMEVARKNANRMIRFINQLLDLRKIESDKASLNLSRTEVVSFTKRVSDYFTEAMRAKGIKFEIYSDVNELYAWLDTEKLDVIIYNLLGNAVKFTPEGRMIKIQIQNFPEEKTFSIAVHDQGSGVEEEQLKNIFELFYEGEHPASRELKGTGIGLALCKEFVHLHGGEICANNNEDGGLTVTLKLKFDPKHYREHIVAAGEVLKTNLNDKPLKQQEILPLPVHSNTPKDAQLPMVLLVEDNDELRMFLTNQLCEFYRVETAKNGEEGLNKAMDFIPDLIVSDIMMPVMDGIQMLDEVKNNLNTSHIPVVLLSAKYSIESQIEGLKYGADYYITKPFNNEFLIASIDNLLRQRKKLFESIVLKKPSVDLSPAAIVVTSKDETFLKEVIKAVEEKMSDPEFNIETMAESMLMSRTTFYKKFKSLTGLTPVEFVRDMRLQRAKQYLDAGGNNVSDAAYLAGFASPKYFSTCFREKYQVSPSDYLKSKVN